MNLNNRELAAQAWCTESTSGIEMDSRLAEAFADILGRTDVAFNTLKNALATDEGYAWSWHCNIALSMYDKLPIPHIADMTARRLSNEAAASFMQLCFGVDMRDNKLYRDLMSNLICEC
jgi:hypothetical protein